MDLYVRADVNFARADMNGHCDLILLTIFHHFDTNHHQGPTNTPNKISAKYTSPFGEMDLNAWVYVIFFQVNINFQTAIVT